MMKSIKQLLATPSSILYRLLQHNQLLEQLDNWLQASLPIPLQQHCCIANLRNTTLVVHTDSSLWATRLRYLTPELLYRWQQEKSMPTINKIEIKIRPLAVAIKTKSF